MSLCLVISQGCSDSKPIHPPAVRSYVPDKPKTTQVVQSAKQLHQRDSSGSLKSFSDSALNVKLSNDKSLVLIWDGETPSRNAYHEQAVMVLKIKGIEYTEEVVSAASPPSWYKVSSQQPSSAARSFAKPTVSQAIADPSLPFLIWKDNKTKEVSPAGRADIKGLFKFVEV